MDEIGRDVKKSKKKKNFERSDELQLKKKKQRKSSCHFPSSDNGDEQQLSSCIKKRKSRSGLTRVVSPYFQNPSHLEVSFVNFHGEKKRTKSKKIDGAGNVKILTIQEINQKKTINNQIEEHEEDEAVFHYARKTKKNFTKSYLKEGEIYEGFLEERIKDENKVRKVSPYFQTKTTAEKQKQEVVLNGCKDSKTKVKPPKSRAKTCRKKVKLSPYFQNVVKEEDGEIAEETKKKKSQVLSASQKRDEAYLRRTPDNTWTPPRSEFPVPLLQEDHVHDAWRVLVICMLLNITTGLQVPERLKRLKTEEEFPADRGGESYFWDKRNGRKR
ncbi:hypothetical protein ACOSP7_004643 [Xanthoceras sorbifolium]